ncbi:MAG: hypothetical protein MR970_08810 [Spirochaetia bacterium]|nr:hypothetical protein [Spirochaetia bacterium]MDD7699282.1 hypothetical protein [Spirochaetia bacterium]MDY4212014.1 hypothetical protein [Treponema sp.]
MKTIFKTIFILMISLLFFSCNAIFDNLSDNQNESNKQIEPGYARVEIIVSDVLSRSVIIPDFSSYKDNIKSYSVSVSEADNILNSDSYEVSASNPVLSVKVIYGTEYTVLVSGKDENSNQIAAGTSTFTPTETNKNVKVTLSPVTQESVNGTVKIPIEFPLGNCSYNVEIKITNTKTNSVSFTHTDTLDCNSASQTIKIEQTLPSSSYKMELYITNSNYLSNTMIFEYDLIVYPQLESKWLLTSSAANELDRISFAKEDLIPVSLGDFVFYVVGTNSQFLGGKTLEEAAATLGFKKAVKFDTVQEAVDAAVALDSAGTVERKIVIDGTVSITTDGTSDSIVTIGDGNNTPNILISGLNSQGIIQRDDVSSGGARIFKISSGAQVKIENLSIKKGSVAGNGGGIYNAGTLTLKSVYISDCSVSGTGTGYGGGVYCDNNAVLTFKDGSITSCSSTNSGGGYYQNGASGTSGATGSTTFSNVIVTDNKATGNSSSGGGIYVCAPGNFSMVRGEIARNTAGKNGGGVVIYSNQNLCSFNEVTMTGNSASGGEGGAILITTGKYCSLYDCPINGNTASTYGQDISTKGTLYLYGSTSVNDCYVMTASSNPAAVKVDSSITGSTSFSLDSYTTGTQILSALSGTLTQDMIDLFSIDNTNYYIDSDGKLAAISAGGSITIEDCTCLFELDKNKVTSGTATTLNVKATLTKSFSDGTTSTETYASDQLTWATVKLYCGSYEVTQADVSGFGIDKGVVKIPAGMPQEDYRLYVSGTYTFSNGSQKGFSGYLPFTVE